MKLKNRNNLKFLTSPPKGHEKSIAEIINSELEECLSAVFVVAFVQESGLRHIQDNKLLIKVSLVTGKNRFSDLNYCEKIKSKLHEVRILEENKLLHCKIYFFKKKGIRSIILGSSNLSNQGLFENYESNIYLIENESNKDFFDAIESEVKIYIKKSVPINKSHAKWYNNNKPPRTFEQMATATLEKSKLRKEMISYDYEDPKIFYWIDRWFDTDKFKRLKKDINKQNLDKEELSQESKKISECIRQMVKFIIYNNKMSDREFTAYIRLILTVLEYVEYPPKNDSHNDLEFIQDKKLKTLIRETLKLHGRYNKQRRVLNPSAIRSLCKNKAHIIKLFSDIYPESERNIETFENVYNTFLRNNNLTGIQSGTISPILSYLQPHYFCTYNNPMRECLNRYFLKELKKYNYLRLENYLLINRIMHDIRKLCGIKSFHVLDNIMAELK